MNSEMPETIPELLSLLEKGNKKAYLHLGFVYESQFDYDNANKYYKLGAESGDPDAQFFYAFRLENGINTEQNIFEANKYYKISADNGNQDAALRYSMNLMEGNGVEYNESESRKYLLLAKEKRKAPGPLLDPDNIEMLLKYADGDEIDWNEVEKNGGSEVTGTIGGNDEAMLLAGFYYEKHNDMAKANQYFKRSADKGNPNAQFIYSLKLENGLDGVKKNEKLAAKYLQLAVDNGNIDAADYVMHKRGRNDPSKGFNGLPNDIPKLKKLADKGNTFAQLRLGLMYDNMQKNDEANAMIKKSADNGNPNAQFIYAMRLEYGICNHVDLAEANSYYRKSAVQGNEDAQYRLGMNLLNGNGVIKNEKEANVFLKMSADLGNKDAAIAYATNLKEGIGCEKNDELGDEYIKKSLAK
ncbi:hypothetical protein TRFO_22024 [Tritrichomonas foetus]|uniref:Sel1 repeat family protein n=1 Tax=Tritrichomonas foetus TaxID=1144522 RepID=A0A1J4KE55_9EUKA|nr:hypothetical protein TRFO_22024 [Tritrichomonas foetus]|eukprot:OHT09192.1 hypothetical protein TRFO_22024 [Tritrichomonas foetus]